MCMNGSLSEDRSRILRILEALWVFTTIALTAMALAALFSILLANHSLPQSSTSFVLSNLVISACVAFPLAALASEHHYRIDRYKAELEAYASTDSLTGLPNRRAFESAAADELKRVQRSQRSSALVIFDLDHFKSLNDAHGHSFGDEVLKDVANTAHDQLRGPMDKLARWGGEEFVVLLNNLSVDEAVQACQRLRRRIAGLSFERNGDTVRVTASFGVVPLYPTSRLVDALADADDALYRAKKNGRNRVEYTIVSTVSVDVGLAS